MRVPHPDREQIIRLSTFWLRPAFVLRIVNRFQKVAGFDRAIALASSSLTALIPLTLLASVMRQALGGKDTATRLIERYDLTGGGAQAVKDVFAPPTGTSTSIGIVGVFFLLIAVLSFTRTIQRLFEQTWELKPLSVRNSVNALIWAAGLAVYLGLAGLLHGILGHTKLELGANLFTIPLSAVFLVWSGYLLSAKRIPWRELIPFGVVGAVLGACYSIGATVYVPHLFSTYATRYGVIGAVFAMISTLFCVMVILVGSAAAGREVQDELVRIRRGERPADDEVRQEWDEVIAEARSRYAVAREQIAQRREQRAARKAAKKNVTQS